MRKYYIALVLFSLFSLANCSADQQKTVMLGYPKELNELIGPVKECITNGFTYDEDKEEWDVGISDSNYPEIFIYNDSGYLISKQWGNEEDETFPYIQSFNESGEPLERRFKDGLRNMDFLYPYREILLGDENWFVNTKGSNHTWHSWNKKSYSDQIEVTQFIDGAYSFDEYFNNLKLYNSGEKLDIGQTYKFIYKLNGSINKVIKSNGNELFFDELGNLINFTSGKKDETYEIISTDESIHKYFSAGEWVIMNIKYTRDSFNNWITKEVLTTYGKWTSLERITREISYYE